MRLKMFSVFDVKAESFSTPWFKPAVGLATRDFQIAANDPQSQISKFPEDFKLVYMADFDDQDGLIFPPEGGKPVTIGWASDFVTKPSDQNGGGVRRVS